MARLLQLDKAEPPVASPMIVKVLKKQALYQMIGRCEPIGYIKVQDIKARAGR